MLEEEIEDDEFRSYQVNVVILEARHLAMTNGDPQITVAVGTERKTLKPKTAPHYNEICIFDFYLPLKDLLDKIVHIGIFGVSKLRKNKFVGSFSVELATVWDQPNHQFYHKWATLVDPNNPTEGVRGYLKCDIGIVESGLRPRATVVNDPGESIEDHLMVPHGEVKDRRKARLVFSVFRADNFSWQRTNHPSTYVKITFGGRSSETRVARHTLNPLWNEELAFVVMIPALYQYIHVELRDADKAATKDVLGSADLDLRKLSRDGKRGFLPTYGPSFLYLYHNFVPSEKRAKCSSAAGSHTYRCRLLMALRTEVVDHAEEVLARKINATESQPKSIPSLKEDKFFRYSEFVLFAAVFDVLLFDAGPGDVSVRINIGPQRPAADEGSLRPIASRGGSGSTADKKERDTKATVSFEDENHRGGRNLPQRKEPDHRNESNLSGNGRTWKKGKNWTKLWNRRWVEGAPTPDDSLLLALARERTKSSRAEEMRRLGAPGAPKSPHSTVTAVGSRVLTEDATVQLSDTTGGVPNERKGRREIPRTSQRGPFRNLRAWPTMWGRRGRRRSASNIAGYNGYGGGWRSGDTSPSSRRRSTPRKWQLPKSLQEWPTEWGKRSMDNCTSSSGFTDEASGRWKRQPWTEEPVVWMYGYGGDTQKRRATPKRRPTGRKISDQWRKRLYAYDQRIQSRHARLQRVARSARHWNLLRGLRTWPTGWTGGAKHPSEADSGASTIKSTTTLSLKKAVPLDPEEVARALHEEGNGRPPIPTSGDGSLCLKSIEASDVEPCADSARGSILPQVSRSRELMVVTSTASEATPSSESEEITNVIYTDIESVSPGTEDLDASWADYAHVESATMDESDTSTGSYRSTESEVSLSTASCTKVSPEANDSKINMMRLSPDEESEGTGVPGTKQTEEQPPEKRADQDDDVNVSESSGDTKESSQGGEGEGSKTEPPVTIDQKRNFWSRNKRTTEESAAKEEEDSEVVEPDLSQIRHVRVYIGCSTTAPERVTTRGNYGYSSFSGRYPCLHINGTWPNALRRMYRSNVVYNSIRKFKAALDEVESELARENRVEASDKLKKALGSLSTQCRKNLSLSAKAKPGDTNLHRERNRHYRRELRDMAAEMRKTSRKKVLVAENELTRAAEYVTTLKGYAEDPEDTLPDTEIWLLQNGKSVGQHRMPTQSVLFSRNTDERGPLSGTVQSVAVRNGQGEVVASLEIFVWFGPRTDFLGCLDALPPGFQAEEHFCPGTTLLDIPVALFYSSTHHFECRVHLFQARVEAGATASELPDLFVRVTVLGQQKESHVQRETLNPLWYEMLKFQDVAVHASKEYVKSNSVALTIEVLNHEGQGKVVGRAVFRPRVSLIGEEGEPPRPTWRGIRKGCGDTGKILLAAELIEVSEVSAGEDRKPPKPQPIPTSIQPQSAGYRLEVHFWGIRDMKKKLGGSTKVYVTLECGPKTITSAMIKNPTKCLNFPDKVRTVDLNLPVEDKFKPPVVLRLYQTGPFVIKSDTYIGQCVVPNVNVFSDPIYDEDRKRKEMRYAKLLEENEPTRPGGSCGKLLTRVVNLIAGDRHAVAKTSAKVADETARECDETADWWVKYFASKERKPDEDDMETLVIYEDELEAQPEFGGFKDLINTFDMTAGKGKKNAETEAQAGKVKAAVKLYRWPADGTESTLKGADTGKGVLKQLSSNLPTNYVARVYVVSCKNLAGKDVHGKSNPYLVLQVGSQKIVGIDRYVRRQANPIFGKCFELRGTFPQEYLLTVRVMDRDPASGDVLVGETNIDLESRYYTKHHASCGIAKTYTRKGYLAWRDIVKPTEILHMVCKRSNVEPPVYTKDTVRVGGYEFQGFTTNEKYKTEMNALAALKCWHRIPVRGYHLVPEHVESRALYHPSYPDIEQGKIEMWVDIFPSDFHYVPPIVDIEPRKPVAMELRAIVWNVEDVTLCQAGLFASDKVCDIYVQGWIRELEEDKQTTDIHYKSMNGKGNFNWRFVFPFLYNAGERRMAVYRKSRPEDPDLEELKFPCKLELQVWDNNPLSGDSLGSLTLELCSMPCGAALPTRCGLRILERSPRINLFKIRRTRGWWPLRGISDAESSKFKETGKIDLELEVVTEAEAQEFPVGKGRDEPRPLPAPQRPEAAFTSSLNPFRSFRFVLWPKYRQQFLLFIIIGVAAAFVWLGIYAIPGYTVKRIGA